MSESSSNKENAKKILISVISTVLAAVIIFYFIEQQKPKSQRKEATLRAWDSYKQNRDIFQKSMTELGTAMQTGGVSDLATAKTQAFSEIDMSVSNLGNIKTQSNVDDRLLSLVDVSINQINDAKDILGQAIDKLSQIDENSLTDEQKQNIGNQVLTEAANELAQIKNKDKIRVTTLKEALCKEYGGKICDK